MVYHRTMSTNQTLTPRSFDFTLTHPDYLTTVAALLDSAHHAHHDAREARTEEEAGRHQDRAADLERLASYLRSEANAQSSARIGQKR